MSERLVHWLRSTRQRRGVIPVALAFLSFAAFLFAGGQFNRQWAAWHFARYPESYSLVEYRITSAQERHHPRQGVTRWVSGTIGDRGVETVVDRTPLPLETFNLLKEGEIDEHVTEVYYAPRFDTHDPSGPGLSSVHVVETDVRGTTPLGVLLDVAAWNGVWLLGVAGLIGRVFNERRVYRQELAACLAENESRRKR